MKLIEDAKYVLQGLRSTLNSLPSRISEDTKIRNIYQSALNHAYHILSSGGGYTPRQFSNFARYAPGADQSRIRNDWTTQIKSMTSLIDMEWRTLVARCELASRTSAYAKSARNIMLDHIIGSGLRPFGAVKNREGELLDINYDLQEGWNRFNDEAIRTGNNKRITVYNSQRLALGTIIDTGALLTNIVNSRKDSLLPFSIQLLKPTRLDWSHDTFTNINDKSIGNAKVVHGIKLNDYGEATGYYIDGYDNPISADKMDLFFYQFECEQYMGLPWYTPVLPFMWDLDQLLQDRILASRLVERIGLWIKNTSKKPLQQAQDADDNTIEWENGRILTTKDKPEVVQSGDRVSETFAPLVRLYLHGIGAGLGFSYVLLTRDLDKVNFASTRFNKIADNRFFRSLYKWIAESYCRSCWELYVKNMFLAGKIKGGYTASQYLNNPWHYHQCYWLPEGEDWVDPLKDAQALLVAYKSGWMTLQDICALKGKDWKSIVKQRKIEKNFLNEHGLQELLPHFEEMFEDNKVEDEDKEPVSDEDRNWP